MAATILNLLCLYPETNPFGMLPTLYNLTPDPDFLEKNDVNRQELATTDATQQVPDSPLLDINGPNPLVLPLVDKDFDSLVKAVKGRGPMIAYQRPPPLAQTVLPEDVEFIGQLNPHGFTPIFIVRSGDNVLLLKLYANRNPVCHNEGFHTPGHHPDPRILFEQESEAYAHLLHYGVNVMPKCYGWVELASCHLEAIFSLPDVTENAWDLRIGDRLPRGIVLEFFPDAEVLTLENITPALADKALRALYDIHSAYVQHCSVTRRHMLVLPGSRVVWADFSQSKNASDKSLTRTDLFEELRFGWDYLYRRMIPDKHNRFTQWISSC